MLYGGPQGDGPANGARRRPFVDGTRAAPEVLQPWSGAPRIRPDDSGPQAVCFLRPHVRVAQVPGEELGRGPVLQRRVPPQSARSARSRARGCDPGPPRRARTRRHDLSLGGRTARRRTRRSCMAGPDGTRAPRRATPRRRGRDRGPAGRPHRRSLASERPDPASASRCAVSRARGGHARARAERVLALSAHRALVGQPEVEGMSTRAHAVARRFTRRSGSAP